MECCGTWNTSCCSFHHQDIVRFDNLKTKYSVNEDIHIEYTLHGHVQQASTRDWLGIFPRGWTNLQQYLTFEYALVAPRAAASSNRTIIFPRVFHQEASTSVEYQLVYVSREIQVLATSSYFRFVREDKTADVANHALKIPYGVRDSSFQKQETHSNQLANSGWCPPHIVLSDQSLLSLHPSKTIPANPRLPRACRSCGRQRENVCGLAAGRARFFAAYNNSLAERVVRLERDLALAESTKCSLAERLKAYENFVAEMFHSLASKGVVKITDASGKEIVLQQLRVVAEDKTRTIEELKNSGSKIGNQESSNSERNGPPETEDLPTNDRPLIGEHLSEEKLLISKKVDEEKDQSQGELNDSSKNDAIVDKKRTSLDVETQTQKIDAQSVENTSKTQIHENNIEGTICNDENTERAVIIKECETFEASVNDREEQKDVPEKGGWTDGETEKSNVVLDDKGKSLLSKPSAIVIQGSNVKFAIIRY